MKAALVEMRATAWACIAAWATLNLGAFALVFYCVSSHANFLLQLLQSDKDPSVFYSMRWLSGAFFFGFLAQSIGIMLLMFWELRTRAFDRKIGMANRNLGDSESEIAISFAAFGSIARIFVLFSYVLALLLPVSAYAVLTAGIPAELIRFSFIDEYLFAVVTSAAVLIIPTFPLSIRLMRVAMSGQILREAISIFLGRNY